MNDLLRNLVASMEDGELEVPASEVPGVDAAVVEVVEAGGEVEQAQDAVEQLASVNESLEAFALLVDRQLASGKGFGLESMTLLQVGVASAMNSIGAQATFLPSMEDAEVAADAAAAGDESALVQVSQEAGEGIKATLVKIWNAIKAACAKVWDVITTFFAKLFGSLSGLEARAKELTKFSADGKKAEGKVSVSAVLVGHGGAAAAAKSVADLVKSVAEESMKESALTEAKAKRLLKGEAAEAEDAKKLETAKTVDAFLEKTKESKAEEVEASSVDVKGIGAAVLDIVGALKAKKDVAKKLKENQEKLLKEAKAAIDESDRGGVAKFADKAGVRATLMLARRNLGAPYAKASKEAIKIGYAAITVGKKAVAAHKEEKKAA